MTEQPVLVAVQPQAGQPPRRPYAPPRLTLHGTVETLTQSGGIGGGDASGVPDGG